MNTTTLARTRAAALALLVGLAATTASAVQIRYELQGVFDESPTPVEMIGGFTFDTDTSSFSDITVRFASNPVLTVATAVFDQNSALYHYATDQFVGHDGLGNAVVLNIDGVFSNPGVFTLTQTGANSISYVLLGATNQFNVVNGTVAAVPEPSTWAALAAGLFVIGFRARRRLSA